MQKATSHKSHKGTEHAIEKHNKKVVEKSKKELKKAHKQLGGIKKEKDHAKERQHAKERHAFLKSTIANHVAYVAKHA